MHGKSEITWHLNVTDDDKSTTVDDWSELDKVDVWGWEDGPDVRPLQSREIVQDVINEAKRGDMSRFHEHFLREFVVPDVPEPSAAGDAEVKQFYNWNYFAFILCINARHFVFFSYVKQVAEDEQRILQEFSTEALGQLGYEYASRTAFGEPALPVPNSFEEATAQMRKHEHEVLLSYMERQALKKKDIEAAANPEAEGGEGDKQSEEEENVEKEDRNQTKWVRDIWKRWNNVCFNARKFSNAIDSFKDQPDDLDRDPVALDPSQEQRISNLESMPEKSEAQKTELKALQELRWIKTRTVRGREQHVAALEKVDGPTEALMTIERLDVALKNKLPDGKIRHILDYFTDVPSRRINSPYVCVTSSKADKNRFNKRYNLE